MAIIQDTKEPKDILNGVTYYDCLYGPQRHQKEKEKYNRKQEGGQNVDHPVHRQQRQQVVGSHKVNCGTRVECKEVFTYEIEHCKLQSNGQVFENFTTKERHQSRERGLH